MDSVIPVRIPQDNVNDDRVLIMEWRVANGAGVSEGDTLVEVETSKAVFEITSPRSGVIRILTSSDQEVPVGEILCLIGPDLVSLDRYQKAGSSESAMDFVPADTAAVPVAVPNGKVSSPARHDVVPAASLGDPASAGEQLARPRGVRLSRLARERLQEQGLSSEQFAGRGLVRTRDLLPVPAELPVGAQPVTLSAEAIPPARSAVGVPFQAEPLSRIKRVESRILAWSTQHAIRSTVTVALPTAGQDRLLAVDLDAPQNRTAFLIQTCAALLRKHPLLNACCLGGEVRRYDQVNIGYAIDGGQGLRVPVLREADTRTLEALAATRRRFIADYLAGALRPEDLAGGTFTITDLSGSGVLTCDPLIAEGQAAILGVGSEAGSPTASLSQHLVLAFDHRLAEGRMAATFLNELKGAVIAWEQRLLGSSSPTERSEPSCIRCGMTASFAAQRNHFLVSTIGAEPGAVSLVCTVCIQGR